MSEPIHWISANPSGTGNITACGLEMVFPMRGNGWRVRDITCPECDRAICDLLHAQAIEARRAETAQTGSVADESAVGNADAPQGNQAA
jgi:hypothetical protein